MHLRVYSRSQTFPPPAKSFPMVLLSYLTLQQTGKALGSISCWNTQTLLPLPFEIRWTDQFQNCLSTNGKSCPMWSKKKLSQDHPVTQIQSEAGLWRRFRGWRQEPRDGLGMPAWLWQMNFTDMFYYSGLPAPKHISHPFVMNYRSVHLFSKHY